MQWIIRKTTLVFLAATGVCILLAITLVRAILAGPHAYEEASSWYL
jgi:hypothetical protein